MNCDHSNAATVISDAVQMFRCCSDVQILFRCSDAVSDVVIVMLLTRLKYDNILDLPSVLIDRVVSLKKTYKYKYTCHTYMHNLSLFSIAVRLRLRV